MSEQLATVEEVAHRYRKCTRTILRWKDQGIIPCVQIGRTVLFDMEKVKAAIEGPKRKGGES